MLKKRVDIPLWFIAVAGCAMFAFGAFARSVAPRQNDGIPDLRIALPLGVNAAGIYLEDITADAARALGLSQRPGVLVASVECGDLQSGDVITTINGNRVYSVADLVGRTQKAADEEPLDVMVLRNGYQQLLTVTRPSARRLKPWPHNPGSVQVFPVAPVFVAPDAVQSGLGQANNPGLVLSVLRGVQIDNVTANVVQQLGLSPVTMGVLVSAVAADTPAAFAGLRPNDIIVDVNSSPVFSVAEFQKMIGPGIDAVVLTINRRGLKLLVTIPAP